VDGSNNAIADGFTAGETYNVSPADITPPSIVSLLRSSPTTQNTTATIVVFAVNFSETVTGVDVTDFTLNRGGTAGGSISSVNGTGAAYTVTVNSITGTGSLHLDLNASGTGIVDGSNNAIVGGFTTGETYNVSPADITPPSIVSLLRSSPATQNTTATTVVFAVSFSEAVSGVDATDFTLTRGGTADGSISSVNGSGAAYTVTVNSIMGTGSLHCGVGPRPEPAIGFMMSLQQIASNDRRFPNAPRQSLGFHTVGDRQRALLEQFTGWTVGTLGGVGGHGAGLFGEFEVGIPRRICRLHGTIAGQHGGNAMLLLAPVDIGDAVAFRRKDQTAQPHARAKDVTGIARLAAASAGAEGGQNRAISAIMPDGEIVQPQFGQRAAQFAHG
jgi:hypothetical protein